jgi:hypothetical protein
VGGLRRSYPVSAISPRGGPQIGTQDPQIAVAGNVTIPTRNSITGPVICARELFDRYGIENVPGSLGERKVEPEEKRSPKGCATEASARRLQGLADSVVKGRPCLANQLVPTIRPGAIG